MRIGLTSDVGLTVVVFEGLDMVDGDCPVGVFLTLTCMIHCTSSDNTPVSTFFGTNVFNSSIWMNCAVLLCAKPAIPHILIDFFDLFPLLLVRVLVASVTLVSCLCESTLRTLSPLLLFFTLSINL